MKATAFQSEIDHISGVTLQTLTIEKSDKPDGTKHEIEIPEGREAIWKVKFLKHKGTWKLAGSERKEI